MVSAFSQIDKLLDIVLSFLESCGTKLNSEIEQSVLECLVWNQYIFTDDCFICYWKIKPEDIEDIKNRIKPIDRVSGSFMYVVECASKSNNLFNTIKQLRKQATNMEGVFWHRPAKQDKVYYFPSQKGEERLDYGK